MTVQTKTIGRLPVNLGDYDSTRAYGRKNRVIQYGCELESLVDNNTYAPMTWDGSETFTLDSTHWRLVSGNPEVWAAGNDKPATTGTTGDYPYNGMGRVVLKKNMVNNVNALTQDMFYKGEVGSRVPNTNTIFVIKYDYVLGEDIEIPANCVLEFEGGSISAGGTNKDTITGQNTDIIAPHTKIFDTYIVFAGNWNVAESFVEWFGGTGDTYNCADYIQAAINFPSSNGLRLLGIYYITRPIALSKYNIRVTGSLGRNDMVFAIRCRNDFASVTVNDKVINSMFYRVSATTVPTIFKDLTLNGGFKCNTVIEPDNPYSVSAIRMDNVSVQRFYESGVIVHSADYNSFHEVEFAYCRVGLEIGGYLVNYENPLGDLGSLCGRQANHVVVDNCSFMANEVGVIASGVTDLILTSNLFGYNSLCSIRLYQVIAAHIRSNYIEGDCNYNFRIYKNRESIPNFNAKTGIVSSEFTGFNDVDIRAYIRVETRSNVYIDKLYNSNFYVRSYIGAPGDAHLNKQVSGIDGIIHLNYNWVPVSLSVDSMSIENSGLVNGNVVENAYDIVSQFAGNNTSITKNSIKVNQALRYKHYYFVNTPSEEIRGFTDSIINSCDVASNRLIFGTDVINANDGDRIVNEFPESLFVLKEIDNTGDMFYYPLQGSPNANSLKIMWDSLDYNHTYKVHLKSKPTNDEGSRLTFYIQVKAVYSDNSSKMVRFYHLTTLDKINDINYYFTKNEFIEEGKTCVAIYISDYTPYNSTYRTPFRMFVEGASESVGIKMPYFISYNPQTEVPISIFNTTSGKPLWWNGSAWVDATGTPI